MALRVVALVLTTPTARALTPPTRVLPGRRAVVAAAAPAAAPDPRRGVRGADLSRLLQARIRRELWLRHRRNCPYAAAAGLVLRAEPTGIARAHALVHVCYGARLCAFLLWRELSVAKFRKLREKIERSAPQGSRLKRAPFILQCGLLYRLMTLPVVASARGAAPTGLRGALAATACVGAWAGFGLAALGDGYKSFAKRRDPGRLVTGGPYALVPPPKLPGRAAAVARELGTVGLLHMNLSVASAATAFASLLGCAGIQFVLLRATTNLDARQAVAYGDEPRYRSWKAWRGPIAKAEHGVQDRRDFRVASSPQACRRSPAAG